MTDLKSLVKRKFRYFGVNKKGEIGRLIYEISKRDNASYKKITNDLPHWHRGYSSIKKSLLGIRFPDASASSEPIQPYLPKLEINPKTAVKIQTGFDYLRFYGLRQ